MTFRCPRRKDTVSNASRPVGREVVCFYRAVSVGTQWETRGKNRQQGLGKKGFPQKKVLSLVLCVAMLLSVMVMGTGAASFTDQDEFSDNYAEAAEVLTGMGIIQGYDDGSFLPQRNINRAQVATMIYRAATGDVTDSKISQFVGEDLFDDVNADDWFAGYVNYCGNAEYIKGFTPDTFGPYKQVTGYQVLAMILRAVGYDENDEYTGDQWTLRVAATAREQGLLDNLNPDTNLAEPATRELVAELIFQAIHPDVDTVHYVPAEGEYQSDDGTSLGEQVFDLAVKDSADEWGRPEVLWTYNTGDEETVIEIDPVATYTTAVNDCDVYEDTGISGDVAAYVNSGRWNDTYNISKTATKDNIGAQGQLVEVYDYTTVNGDDAARIVVIDTFLAQVTDVVEAKYDSNNHLATEATLVLNVYDESTPVEVTLTNGSTNYTYAVGDMLLVNAYTNDKDEVISGDGQYVEIVSAAESFVGAQTTIHYNADTHTINGTEYNDAYKFFRDDAGVTEDYNFTWYLDQYGNVIGATGITSNYAVLKDMIWVNGGRDGGYAEATLVYMDGTEATVTVDSIDEFDFSTPNWDENDVTPYLADSIESVFNGTGNFGGVSSDSSLNGNYDGFAMYRVDTNSDGSVNLEGKELYKLPSQTDSYMFEIEYADNVTLNINASAIVDVNNLDVVTHVSNSTQFLLKNGDTYTAYTGTANLPDFNWETVEVFYDDEDNDSVADYVYIKSYSDVHGMYVFATSESAEIRTNDYGVYIENVYVDGEEKTIIAEPDVAVELLNNLGKLYYATWNTNHDDANGYGLLQDITLVSENTDNDVQVLFGGIANYLNENIDNNFAYVNGTLIVNDSLSYNVGSTVEVIYTNDDVTYTMNLADVVKAMKDGAHYGLWIVGNRYDNAVTVYAGTELDETNTIDVTATKDDADKVEITAPTKENADTWTVNILDKNNNGNADLVVDMDATNDYAFYTIKRPDGSLVQVDGSYQLTEDYTLENVSAGEEYIVTAYTECGLADTIDSDDTCAHTGKTWTIEVTGWDYISGAIDQVAYGGTENSLKKDVTVHYSYADAVTDPVDINTVGYDYIRFYGDNDKVVTNDDTTWPVKYMTFTNSDDAREWAGDFGTAGKNMTNATDDGAYYQLLDISKLTTGNVIVLRYTPQQEGGNYVYVAFEIQK